MTSNSLSRPNCGEYNYYCVRGGNENHTKEIGMVNSYSKVHQEKMSVEDSCALP